MRALLAASLGSLCTAALIVPLAQPAAAHFATAPELSTRIGTASSAGDTADAERPARTRTLDLAALGEENRAAPAGSTRLGVREVAPFSLLGAVWDDVDEELHGRIEVRTRSGGSGAWTGWTALQSHTTDAPDQNSAERTGRTVRGSTAPLWVGASDAVDVRLVRGGSRERAALPEGLRLSLVDPGEAARQPAGRQTYDENTADHSVTADSKPGGAAPRFPGAAAGHPGTAHVNVLTAALAGLDTKAAPSPNVLSAQAPQGGAAADAAPIGPRPGIVTRSGWGADESWREPGFSYTTTVKSAFVHHTAESNNYTCAQAPSVIRSIYQYHVRSLGWRDIGYNFLVDKCGTIYEGRAGGVAKAVLGAHTYGFNSNTTGIAVLGTFGSTEPPKAAVEGVSKLIAWKLGLHGLNPVGSVTLTSGGGKWPAGTQVKMRAVAGHRDGFATECPGAKLYAKLPEIRTLAARLQGR